MPLGPWIYQNRKLYETNPGKWRFQREYPIFAECNFLGTVEDGDPCINYHNVISSYPEAPALVIRITEYVDPNEQIKKMDQWDWYHNGGPQDEVAALVSLLTGTRVIAGGPSRSFERDKQPYGEPEYWVESKKHNVIRPSYESGSHSSDIVKLNKIQKIFSLPPEGAIAVIRCARTYQEGKLLSGSNPELAWLLFVSAVETASNYWAADITSNVDKLKTNRNLYAVLEEQVDSNTITAIANILAPTMGATSKFLKFLINFLPSTPDIRPEFGLVDWEKSKIKKALNIVYEHRCHAVHAGVPFPALLCNNRIERDTKGIPVERPCCIAGASMGGYWEREELPMYLHIFDFIVRGALDNWLDSL